MAAKLCAAISVSLLVCISVYTQVVRSYCRHF